MRQATALVLLIPILALTPRADARAASPAWPVRGISARAAGPSLASERVVLRLGPEPSRRARLEWERDRAASARGPGRVPALDALARRMGVTRVEPEFPGEPAGGDPDLSVFWIAHLDPATPLAAALAAAEVSAEVVEAAPIGIVPVEPLAGDVAGTPEEWRFLAGEPLAVPAPDDSMWSRCYWLYQSSRRDLHALEAWQVTRGDSAGVIAVLDTGVLRWHPDLGGRVAGDPGRFWTNRAEERGVPGVDDDGNGYVDDTWGWDFVALDSASLARPGEDWRDEDNDPVDFAVHGTAVAGVAVAIANNGSGTAGVAPEAKIMTLRVGYSAPLSPPGEIDLSWVARAILYAVHNGATVINCSFSSFEQPDLAAAVATATRAGVVVMAAAGNRGPGTYLGERDDVISVTATDSRDKVTLFSTLGDWVDFAAPGQSIATTTLRPTGTDSIGLRTPHYSPGEAGTSFSAPMGSAAVALLQGARRARGLRPLTPEFVRFRIAETADEISALNPLGGFGAGRLNLERLLTDPPRSIGHRAGAGTVGAAVLRPRPSGGALLAYATTDSMLLVMDAASGDTVRLAPLGGAPAGGPAAVERGDGREPALFVALRDGRIAGLDFAGRRLPGWPVATAPSRSPFDSYPALADVDGDGGFDVVWGGADGNVWAWKAGGTPLPGFPRAAGRAGDDLRVTLADLDGRPGAEIVVASNNDSLYAFRGDGTPLAGWPVQVGAVPTWPLVTKLGALRRPAVVVGAGSELRGFDAAGHPIFRRNHYPIFFSWELAEGDLTGDGVPELVGVSSGITMVAAFDSSGAPVAQGLVGSRPLGPAILGPLARGSTAQVLVPAVDPKGGVRHVAFDSALAVLPGWPKDGASGASPSLGEFDGDGATEIAAGSGGRGTLYVYDAGAASWRPGAVEWPTARGGYARTGGRLPVSLPPADETPPAAVADLRVVAGANRSLTLAWTATGGDGEAGRADRYRLCWAEAPLDDAAFDASRQGVEVEATAGAGGVERATLAGLPEGRQVWVRLRAYDAAGNGSPLSNSADARVGRLAGAAGVALVPARSPTAAPVEIAWRGDPAAGESPQTLTLFDLAGRVVRRFVLPSGAEGTLRWDGTTAAGQRAPAGLYLARLRSGAGEARARIVLVR